MILEEVDQSMDRRLRIRSCRNGISLRQRGAGRDDGVQVMFDVGADVQIGRDPEELVEGHVGSIDLDPGQVGRGRQQISPLAGGQAAEVSQ